MELPKSKVAGTIAGLLIVGALVALWFEFRPATQSVDRTPIVGKMTGMGDVLAEETVKAVHGKGRIVVVTPQDPAIAGRWPDDRWETFQRELKKHTAINIIATEIVPADGADGPPPGCSRAAFQTLLERHAQADAIVFFMNLPDWERVETTIPQLAKLKIIVVDDHRRGPPKRNYAGYFVNGILAALIGERTANEDQPASQPKTPREWFDKFYQVYTPQNYESLPE